MSDGDARPDAAAALSPPLAAALAAFAAQTLAADQIDRLWIFPPRRLGEAESALAVIAAFGDAEPDAGDEPEARRRIYTVRAESTRSRGRTTRTDQVAEQGSAPLARLPRVMAGVVRRLGTEDAAPAEAEIGGDAARWAALLGAAARTQP